MSRTAVVTGAAGGIGAATVRAFREAGWRTIGLDRSDASGASGADRSLRCDVSDVGALHTVIEELASELQVDALVNNAAVPMDRGLADLTVDEWELTMNTNVRSAFVLTQGLLDQLSAQRGAVVNVASVHAVATTRGVIAYAASKGALVAFSRAASLDLAEVGVRCNAVCPGATDTDMLHAGLSAGTRGPGSGLEHLIDRTPAKRIADPTEIAQAILFLADSARSGFITGQSLIVDGGATSRLGSE